MGVRPPSLRAIAAFEAAARHQNFTRAAEELNLTQSAVSHAIRGLEERLCCQLFRRFGRVVNLTDDGRVLFGRLRLSLDLIAEAFDGGDGRERRRLTVAFQPGFAERLVASRLTRFRSRHPEFQLDIRSAAGLAELPTGEVDMAVWFGTGGWPGLSAELLANETLWVVTGKTRRGSAAPRFPEELAHRPLIHYPQLPWRTWLEGFGLDNPATQAEATVNDVGLAISLAREGLGAALAPRRLVEHEVRSGSLVRLFDAEVPAPDGYYALWAPSSPKESLARAFAAWLREELEPATAPGRGPALQLVQ